jgi:glutaredoxin
LFHDNEASGWDPSPQVPASLASTINTSSKKTQDQLDLDQDDQPKSKCLRDVHPQMDKYHTLHFRPFRADPWDLKFDELIDFKKEHGHFNVPRTFPENPVLAGWVKRQRYQYRLKNERKASAMTDRRVKTLERAGFVWDLQSMAWEERLKDLQEYLKEHGDCNVPTLYIRNKKLGTCVQCQRRQYKLFRDDMTPTLNMDRINRLNRMGFTWEVRGARKVTKEDEVL